MRFPEPFETHVSQAPRYQVLGIPHIVLIDGPRAAGRLALVEVELPPGSGIPPHVHTREDEAFVVLEGEIEFRLGDRAVRGGPGFTAYGPRDRAHAYRNGGSTTARMLVTVVPAGIESMFAEIAAVPPAEMGPQRLTQIVARYGISFA